MERDRLRLKDLIASHHEELLSRHGSSLSPEARRALRDVLDCRTAALGGQARVCADCGHVEVHYRSCGNRHCPGCGAGKRAAWLEREAELLLPVPYHHVVFTLPEALHGLARAAPRLVYNLLFQSASATVQEVAADPRHLGAQVALLLVLHTWGQNLHLHPHVHGLVTAGGLSCDASGQVEEQPRWLACRPGFFLPVRVLSRVFRGKFVAGLRAAFGRGEVPGWSVREFEEWLRGLYAHEWVVYSQPPAPTAEVVLKYLARYVSRVALSESRLLRLAGDQVTLSVKDYAAGGVQKELTLPVVELLRRWTEHVLPRGFVAARHYGLLANRGREEKLALCRRLLWPLAYVAVGVGPAPAVVCPRCGGAVRLLALEVAEWATVGAVAVAGVAAGVDSS